MSTREEEGMSGELPAWAQELVPITHDDAAKVLGVNKWRLYELLREHPHYETRGRVRLFYPEHIARLREATAVDMRAAEAAAMGRRALRQAKASETLLETRRRDRQRAEEAVDRVNAKSMRSTLAMEPYDRGWLVKGCVGKVRVRKRFPDPGGEEAAALYMRDLVEAVRH